MTQMLHDVLSYYNADGLENLAATKRAPKPSLMQEIQDILSYIR